MLSLLFGAALAVEVGNTVQSQGHEIHYVTSGLDAANTPVLFLHGSPDSWRLWRHQIKALEAAGVGNIIAMDLRGHGDSAKPGSKSEYHLRRNLLPDVLTLLDELEIERAYVVGHDWGAALGWTLAAYHPERVVGLIPITFGHFGAMRQFQPSEFGSLWYHLFTQTPFLPELLIPLNNYWMLRAQTNEHPEVPNWIENLEKPGGLKGFLNIFRANSVSIALGFQALPIVRVPVLGMFSEGDRDLLHESHMVNSGEFVDGPWEYFYIEDASHWSPLDQPEVVSGKILEFIQHFP